MGLVDIVDDGESFERLKPEIVLFYNRTKGGVDRQDHLISKYTCCRKTEKWTLRLFMFLIDAAALNPFILFKKLNPKVERRNVLKELGKALVKPFVEA